MANTPIPLTTDGSGPDGAIPVSISGPVGTFVTFSGIIGSIPGVTGADLQEILEDLAARLSALE